MATFSVDLTEVQRAALIAFVRAAPLRTRQARRAELELLLPAFPELKSALGDQRLTRWARERDRRNAVTWTDAATGRTERTTVRAAAARLGITEQGLRNLFSRYGARGVHRDVLERAPNGYMITTGRVVLHRVHPP